MTHHLTKSEWVAIAAHRLQFRWRSINPGELEHVAEELWDDGDLAALEPAKAVDRWLAPVIVPPPSVPR